MFFWTRVCFKPARFFRPADLAMACCKQTDRKAGAKLDPLTVVSTLSKDAFKNVNESNLLYDVLIQPRCSSGGRLNAPRRTTRRHRKWFLPAAFRLGGLTGVWRFWSWTLLFNNPLTCTVHCTSVTLHTALYIDFALVLYIRPLFAHLQCHSCFISIYCFHVCIDTSEKEAVAFTKSFFFFFRK